MHDSSLREMFAFVNTLPDEPLRVIDIGSRGSQNYKAFFSKPDWIYCGADLQAGENVDVVLGAPYEWSSLTEMEADVVVSGQCLEHVGKPWLWIREIRRILRPGGRLCIVAPHSWAFHPSPRDCWRIWPDGMKDLLEWGGFKDIKVWKNENDTVGVARG
jgi:SAM-dependent methyltransferase